MVVAFGIVAPRLNLVDLGVAAVAELILVGLLLVIVVNIVFLSHVNGLQVLLRHEVSEVGWATRDRFYFYFVHDC